MGHTLEEEAGDWANVNNHISVVRFDSDFGAFDIRMIL